MAITRWSGGRSGNETMPSSIVSVYYTEINREVPNLFYDKVGGSLYPYGYYVGPASAPYEEHITLYPYRENTLSATINGVSITIEEVSPSTGVFKIPQEVSGWVRVSYMPYDEEVYYAQADLNTMPLSPARHRLIPTNRDHLNEIIIALNNIAIRLQTIQRELSISSYTGIPIRYVTGDIGIEPATPVITQLYQEIGEYIIFLYNYALTSENTPIVPDDSFSYTASHVSADTIENFRRDINILEAALDM